MRESFQKDDGSFVSKEEIVDGLNRARLVRFCSFFRPIKSQAHVTDTCSGWHSRTWNHCAFVLVFFLSVWLFNVYVFAHSLCIGTLRTPLSRRTSADIHLILLTPRPPATGEECRDIRLRLGAELFDIAERQNMSEVINLEGVEPWFLSRKEALEEVNRIQRMLLPLPGKHCLVLLSLSLSLLKLNLNISVQPLRSMTEPILRFSLSSSVSPAFSSCIARSNKRGCPQLIRNSLLQGLCRFKCKINQFLFR